MPTCSLYRVLPLCFAKSVALMLSNCVAVVGKLALEILRHPFLRELKFPYFKIKNQVVRHIFSCQKRTKNVFFYNFSIFQITTGDL